MMEEFIKELEEYGVPEILDKVKYEYTGFTGDTRFFYELDYIRKSDKRVLIHGDSDPDGAYGVKIAEESFDKLGFKNYEIYRYKKRSHVLTDEAVNYAIYNRFDYILIIDSSTNDFSNISKLVKFGVKPIILDHHVANHDLDRYPDECIIINTIIENRIRNMDFYRLSGGALTFCLFSKYLENNNIEYNELSAYALITLYADSIDMTRKLNRGIYYMATELDRSKLPKCVKDFLEDYYVFSRRFIEYIFVPKINALFRAEELEILNKYLFDDNSFEVTQELVRVITDIHESKRNMVNIVTDEITKELLGNIVIANLSSSSLAIEVNKLYNYTGLVANNLSTEYGKPCVVLCDTGTSLKASFRDSLSRSYLGVFKQFCNAEGHGAAFGINLQYTEYEDFMYYLREKIDKKFFILGVSEPLEVDVYDESPDPELITSVSLYNEFSGIDVPIALLRKKNNMSCVKSYNGSYPYKYTWSNLKVESKSKLITGSVIKIKPILTNSIRLLVFSRNVVI